jgi:hypothetical protein
VGVGASAGSIGASRRKHGDVGARNDRSGENVMKCEVRTSLSVAAIALAISASRRTGGRQRSADRTAGRCSGACRCTTRGSQRRQHLLRPPEAKPDWPPFTTTG